jgi:hypothetical protein
MSVWRKELQQSVWRPIRGIDVQGQDPIHNDVIDSAFKFKVLKSDIESRDINLELRRVQLFGEMKRGMLKKYVAISSL